MESNTELLNKLERLWSTKAPKNTLLSFKQQVLDDKETLFFEIGYDLKIKTANKNLLDMTGLKLIDIIGKPITDFIPKEEVKKTKEALMTSGFIKKRVEFAGRLFLALVFKIEGKESFGEYLIELS